MTMLREIHRRARKIAPQVIAACLVGYFAYHAVQGERGLHARVQLQKDLEQAEAIAHDLAAERRAMERRVALLRPDSLDPDMLEERARQVLNFTRENEAVVFLETESP